LVPYIKGNVYNDLLVATLANQLSCEAGEQGGAIRCGVGGAKGRDLPKPNPDPAPQDLPRTWDEIAPGHLVIAREALEIGWWEVVVIERTGDLVTVRHHHVPGQLGDPAGPQASLERQQQDQMVSAGVPGGGGKDEEASCLLIGQYLGLFSRHNEEHLNEYTCRLLDRSSPFKHDVQYEYLLIFAVFLNKYLETPIRCRFLGFLNRRSPVRVRPGPPIKSICCELSYYLIIVDSPCGATPGATKWLGWGPPIVVSHNVFDQPLEFLRLLEQSFSVSAQAYRAPPGRRRARLRIAIPTQVTLCTFIATDR
jgi:hypothetical protein